MKEEISVMYSEEVLNKKIGEMAAFLSSFFEQSLAVVPLTKRMVKVLIAPNSVVL